MDLYKSSEITVHQLNELREENKKIQILDVREDTERDHAHIKGTIHMKLSEIAEILPGKIIASSTSKNGKSISYVRITDMENFSKILL